MPRVVYPPVDEFCRLRQPLTRGERAVFEFFDHHLPDGWEIYVQPHLNGRRPDFVLLNPTVGIAVFEVKDWDLDAVSYECREIGGKRPRLRATDARGTRWWMRDDPVRQVLRCEREILDLYCPRLDGRSGLAVITAGVIFPFADDDRVRDLLSPLYPKRTPKTERYYPIGGRRALGSGDIEQVFPEALRAGSMHMTPELAADLRHWLVEPDFAATQRETLRLTPEQEICVNTRTTSGYRRIKGPSGSGKSTVIAARAAKLAAEGKSVLVVTYNITLLHFLMDLAVRAEGLGGKTRERVTWLNFHAWCKRVFEEADREDAYGEFWQRFFAAEDRCQADGLASSTEQALEHVLENDLPTLVEKMLQGESGYLVERYDAILVDEGQDFRPSWWKALRKVLKPGGEMVLAADATQDIYGRAREWTEEAMHGAGFRGSWRRLHVTHRMPPRLIERAREFAERFLPEEVVDPPVGEQLELALYPCEMRWVQTAEHALTRVCVGEVRSMPIDHRSDVLAFPDITLLFDRGGIGKQVVRRLEAKGIKVVHTFGESRRDTRRRKLGFFMGDARVKATTVHSFKGWETRALIVCVSYAAGPSALAGVYTAMTRLKRHVAASRITVVCADPRLEAYGRTWPEFVRRIPPACAPRGENG